MIFILFCHYKNVSVQIIMLQSYNSIGALLISSLLEREREREREKEREREREREREKER